MNENVMRWSGGNGHYEVWYLTLTDRPGPVGLWIRYTMVAPLRGEPTCSLWFLAMDHENPERNFGKKLSFPIAQFKAEVEPFRVEIAGASLSDYNMQGELEHEGNEITWDLSWQPRLPAYSHVHPLLRKAKIAKTIVTLPHPDLEISGSVCFDGRQLDVDKARGGQAHLWGSKHATRWVWAHCNDFGGSSSSALDAFFDGVSVFVPRFGRELGPNSPLLARVGGRDFSSIGPLAVVRNKSDFDLCHWSFESRGVKSKIVGHVQTRKQDLVGVTYHDPDGELAYCYNTEVADMTLQVFERPTPWGQWQQADELVSKGAAHFEYAQRQPLDEIELKTI